MGGGETTPNNSAHLSGSDMADGSFNFSLTTFDKTGKLGQIEHALKAVEKGHTTLGLRGTCPARSMGADGSVSDVSLGCVWRWTGPPCLVVVCVGRGSGQACSARNRRAQRRMAL